VHLRQQAGGAPGDEFEAVLPRDSEPEAVPVELFRRGVEHSVEFEHCNRVMKLKAACEDCQLFAMASSWRIAYAWVLAIVIEVAWTVDHVTSETRPTCSRTVKASSTKPARGTTRFEEYGPLALHLGARLSPFFGLGQRARREGLRDLRLVRAGQSLRSK
jgi:hypothetical protein